MSQKESLYTKENKSFLSTLEKALKIHVHEKNPRTKTKNVRKRIKEGSEISENVAKNVN